MKANNMVDNDSRESIAVTQSSLPPFEEYTAEIAPLWDSHWLTNMGVKHHEFEIALRAYLGVEHLELFTNGHLALECALAAFELQGEVITTPFTFASTTHAIVRSGLTPVFADIREDDFTLDANAIEALITPRTSAILPVHVYGNLCDTAAIESIAQQHGLTVIYDAAHAFGVERDGRSALSYGDASMVSFHATKVFNSIEGGAVCFADPAKSERAALMRNYGIVDAETTICVGGNAKMNEFCAAMGLCNLRHLKEEIMKREKVVARYRENLSGVTGITLPLLQAGTQSNYAYFPVLFDEDLLGISRDEVFAALAQKNIHARKYFYPLTSDFECYRNRFDSSLTPIARRVASQVLTLPLYADLTLGTVDSICDIILETLHSANVAGAEETR